MNKRFSNALRPDIKVRDVGRKIEVSGGGLTYRIPQRGANADTAALINSKIPAATLRPPLP